MRLVWLDATTAVEDVRQPSLHRLRGDRPVAAELALRLGRALGQTPQYRLDLQSSYDWKVAQAEWKSSLRAVRELTAA